MSGRLGGWAAGGPARRLRWWRLPGPATDAGCWPAAATAPSCAGTSRRAPWWGRTPADPPPPWSTARPALHSRRLQTATPGAQAAPDAARGGSVQAAPHVRMLCRVSEAAAAFHGATADWARCAGDPSAAGHGPGRHHHRRRRLRRGGAARHGRGAGARAADGPRSRPKGDCSMRRTPETAPTMTLFAHVTCGCPPRLPVRACLRRPPCGRQPWRLVCQFCRAALRS